MAKPSGLQLHTRKFTVATEKTLPQIPYIRRLTATALTVNPRLSNPKSLRVQIRVAFQKVVRVRFGGRKKLQLSRPCLLLVSVRLESIAYNSRVGYL